MPWKSKAYWSMIWFVFTMAVGVGFLWYISDHSMGDRVDEIRAGKAGQLVGMLLCAGLLVIWVPYFLSRGQRNRDSAY